MIIVVKKIRDIARIVINMTHTLDKETIKRILYLYEKQNLEPKIIAQRFGFSTSRVYNLIRRKSNEYERKNAR
tara:strand:+ start:192 stop:410 length:219 start_codon:yes stop_codon:yes gene_type:complete